MSYIALLFYNTIVSSIVTHHKIKMSVRALRKKFHKKAEEMNTTRGETLIVIHSARLLYSLCTTIISLFYCLLLKYVIYT